MPRALRPSTLLTGLVRSAPVQSLLDQTIGRLGVPGEVLGHVNFSAVFDSRRTEKALSGSGISVPDLESYARALWAYWEENLDESTGRDPRIREALTGKYVVITGASSGIGRVTALKVAQAGGVPVLVARGKDKLEETRATIELRGGTAHVYPCDLSDLEAIDALCEQLVEDLPSIDFVVNNAGRSIRRSLRLSARPVPRLRAHHAAQLLRRDPAGDGAAAGDARAAARPRRQRLLDRRADQPAALLGVRRLEGGAGLLEQRGRLRAGRRRRHLHRASTCRWCGRR